MTEAISILVFAAYAVLDGLADAFIFRDQVGEQGSWAIGTKWWNWAAGVVARSADLNTNWHRAQAAQQALVIGTVAYLAGHWSFMLLGAAIFWMLHDGIVNRVGLSRPWFFVGTTAWIDRQFQKFRRPELLMGVAKVVSIAAGAVWLVLEKVL